MGDRANIVFKQEKGFLGVYMHNGGYVVRSIAAQAIARVLKAGRVNDVGYANRIAVSEIVGENWSQDYSYGLYVGPTINEALGDNEYDVIVIDWQAKQVDVYAFDYKDWKVAEIKETCSLEEFVKGAMQP